MAEERLALERADRATGPNEDRRLQALARAATEAGDVETAQDALRRRLTQATVRHALRVLDGHGPRDDLDAVRREILAQAAAARFDHLYLDALEGLPDPALGTVEKLQLRESVARVSFLSASTYRRAHALGGTDERFVVALARRRPYLRDLPTVGDAALARRGLQAVDVLETRFGEAVSAGNSARTVDLAARLVVIDPLHVEAQIALALAHDLRRAPARLGTTTREDVLGARDWHGGALARLGHLLRQTPAAAPAYRLAFARRAWEAGLMGDCRDALSELPPRDRARPAVASAADTLAALCALEGGDRDAFDRWARRARPERSYYVTRRLAAAAGEGVNPARRAAARQAVETALDRGYRDIGTPPDLIRVLTDAGSPAARRALARERLVALGVNAPVLSACQQRGATPARCQQLADAALAVEDAEHGEMPLGKALGLLAAVPGYRVPWAAITDRIDGESAAAVAAALAREPAVGTADALYAACATLLHRREARRAARLLERYGRYLAPGQRVTLRLALAAVGQGQPPAQLLGAGALEPFAGLGHGRPATSGYEEFAERMKKLYPGGHLLAAYHRGHALFNARHYRPAITAWTPVLAALSGEERALLEASIGAARLALGEVAAARAVAERVRAAAPDAPASWVLWGRLHEQAGELREAAQTHRRVLQVTPGSSEAFEDLVRVSARLPGAGAERLVRFVRVLAPVNSAGRRAQERLDEVKPRDATEVGLLSQPFDEATFAAAERGRRGPALDREAARFLTSHAGELERPEDVIRWAKRAVAYQRAFAVDTADARETWAWLHFLAGDASRALAVLRAGEKAAPTAHPLALLAPARSRAQLGDGLAVTVWRNRTRWNAKPLEAVQALQAGGLTDAGVQQYLCRLLVDANLVAAATRPCSEAWRQGRRNDDLAAAVSWLVRSGSSDAAAAGLTPDSVFTNPGATPEALGPSWLYNRAAQEAERNRIEEAGALVDAAWRAGAALRDLGIPEKLRDRQTEDAGLAFRFLTATNTAFSPAERLTLIASLAACQGRPSLTEHYARAALALGLGSHPDLATTSLGAIDLARVFRDDLARGRLTRPIVMRVFWAAATDTPEARDALERLAKERGASRLVRLVRSESLTGARLAEAVAITTELLREFPDNVAVRLAAIRAHFLAGRADEARSLLNQGLARHSGDVRLEKTAATLGARPDVPLPAWVKTPAAFDALAARGGAPATVPEVTRHAAVDLELEAFVPKDYSLALAEKLSFTTPDGLTLHFLREPNSPRCELMQCLDAITRSLKRARLTEHWRRVDQLPLGPAAQALLAAEQRGLLAWVVPTESHVYMIGVGGPLAALRRRAPELLAVARSAGLLRGSVAAVQAEAIRRSLPELPPDRDRHRARATLAASGSGTCLLRPLLNELRSPEARSSLLADVLLGATTDDHRRAVMRCTSPAGAEAQQLGVIAVLNESPDLHAFGVRAVAAHPLAALEQARALIDAGYADRPSAGFGPDLAPYGALEALLALPETQRREFAERLLHSGDKRLHFLGLAAGVFDPQAARRDVVEADIRNAPVGTALLAGMVGMGAPDDTLVAAARARLADLVPGPSREQAVLAWTLTSMVAAALAARDEAVLAQAATRAQAGRGHGHDLVVTEIERLVATHRHGVALESGRVPPADPQASALLARVWRRAKHKESAADVQRVSERVLEQKALAELLPAGEYVYARVPAPGEAGTRTKHLLARTRTTDSSRAVTTHHGLAHAAMVHGLDFMSDQRALDLSRPVECVAPRSDSSFVCTAYVRDPHRVRAHLARRQVGANAGPALGLSAVRGTADLPEWLVTLPATLYRMLYPQAAAGPSTRLLSERLRTTERVGGHLLERYATVEVHEGLGVLLDHEHYLFIRDRLFIFGGRHMAQLLLGGLGPGDRSLADQVALPQALARLPRDATLQGLVVTRRGAAWDTTTLAVTLDRDGATLQWQSEETAAATPGAGALQRWLPPGAVASFAATSRDPLRAFAEELTRGRRVPSAGTPPPRWLLDAAPAAFGWYPRAGAAFWDRWVLVLPATAAATSLLTSHGWAVPRDGDSSATAGLTVRRRADVLQVSPDPTLLQAPPAAPSPRTTRFHASLEPTHAAEVLEAAVGRTEVGEEDRARGRFLAALLRSLGRLSVAEAPGDPAGRLLRARLTIGTGRVAPPVDPAQEMLSLQQGVRLPRRIEDHELRRPLVFVMEPTGPGRIVAREHLPNERVTIRRVDPRRVEVRVRPGAREREPVTPAALPAMKRQQWVSDSPDILVSSPEIQTVARAIARDAPRADAVTLAQHVGRWVYRNMTYESTTTALSTVAILARRRGDCTEYSALTVALLRALGVPAHVEEGLTVAGDVVGGHAWVRYHDGVGFRELDPTRGDLSVDSGHLALSVLDLVGLVANKGLRIVAVKVDDAPAGRGQPPR